MRVIHTLPGLITMASGTAACVPLLCQSLHSENIDVELHIADGKKLVEMDYEFYCHGLSRFPPFVTASPKMRQVLDSRMKSADLIHSHGLWSMANVYPGWASQKHHKPLVMTPHGTLGDYPLSRSRWKKRFFWQLWQKKVFLNAACIHATCDAECEEIRRMGAKSPIAMIPNGLELPSLSEIEGIPPLSSRRRLLFLSRTDPKKAIDNLLHAWQAIQGQFTDWELHITGQDRFGNEEKMKQLAQQLQLDRVTFTGPIYGADKMRAYCEADIFVLPTRSENFGMVVGESLAHGTPAIVSKGAPWEGLETNDCGWWIDIGVDPLVDCLKVAMDESPEKLKAKGMRGREWIARDFSWKPIGKKMVKTYEWILNGGVVPEWVNS